MELTTFIEMTWFWHSETLCEILVAIVFGHEIHILIPSFGQNLENVDDNKEKLTAKFAKMDQNFFSPI